MRRLQFEAVGLASALLIILALSAFAQHHAATPQPSLQHAHGTSGAAGQWEGSPAGKAYSEFNHHLAGVFVLLPILSRHWCCVETESRAPDRAGGWPGRLSSCSSGP